MKQQLIDYLNSFKSLINVNFKGEKKITNIELFSGIKPASYYIPNILGYLNHPPYSNRGEMVEIAWFVEIWIDNVCIRYVNTHNPSMTVIQGDKFFKDLEEMYQSALANER